MSTKENTAANTADGFDIDQLDAIDEAEMTVMSNGRPTTWKWRFAGPGHAKAIEVSNRIARDRLRKDAEQEQARVNGKKWKADDETPEALAKRNADYIIDRLLGWSPVKFAGEDYPFTVENARKLLLDPRKGALAVQALEFLADNKSFMKRSAAA